MVGIVTDDKKIKHTLLKLEIYGNLKTLLRMFSVAPADDNIFNADEKEKVIEDFVEIGISSSLKKHSSEAFLRVFMSVYFFKIYTERKGIKRASCIIDWWNYLADFFPYINHKEGIARADIEKAMERTGGIILDENLTTENILKTFAKSYIVVVQAVLAWVIGDAVLDVFFQEQTENKNQFTGEGCVQCNIEKNILKEDG